MKVLIWFVSFFCMAVIQMIIKDSGIILGGIPTALLFGLTWFVAQKLCKIWDNRKKEATADTHNDEPIVDVVSETDAETTPPKKLNKQVSTVPTKVCSFILRYRKVFLILTIISSVLFIASLITYNSLGTLMSKMADHYYETRVIIEWAKITEFGCGMISCPYCEGTVVRNYNYGRGIYSIGKYSRTSDIRAIFELCYVVFALLAIVGLTALIIDFVHQRNIRSKRK